MRFDRKTILKGVMKCREEYSKRYLETLNMYQQAARILLQQALDATDEIPNSGLRLSQGTLRVILNAPSLNLNEYDQAISMLENTIDEAVEIDEYEYARYGLNQWPSMENLDAVQEQYENIIKASRERGDQ